MRSTALLLATVMVTSSLVAMTEAIILVSGLAAGSAAALTLGGLAALKGAALVGFAAGRLGGRRSFGRRRFHGRRRHHHRHFGKRSIQDMPQHEEEESEDVLLDAVSQLDPQGCVLKLLCQLQAKEETQRTFEEDVLVDMFSNGTQVLTSHNAAFVYASDVGRFSHSSAACDQTFPQCPLDQLQLSTLLQKSWGCGISSLQTEENLVETQGVPQE